MRCFTSVHAADSQDRDGAVDVLKAVRLWFPWLRHVFADGAYGVTNSRTRSSDPRLGTLSKIPAARQLALSCHPFFPA